MSSENQLARFINPPEISTPRGYTHVVEVLSGRPVYISGQVPLDQSGNVVGKGDMRAQTVQVFENLKAALAAVGLGFDSIVKFSYFLTDITTLPIVREVRNEYLAGATPPASTAVGVTGLFMPDLLIEVEAVAILPE